MTHDPHGAFGDHFTPTQHREPRLERIEICWRVVGPSKRVLTCALYRTDAPGVEVRSSYTEDSLVSSSLERNLDLAREKARLWHGAVMAMGSFEDVTLSEVER